MTKTKQDELAAMTDDELHARSQNLDALWKRLDRRSDPDGTYTERQRLLEVEQSLIEQILRSRRPT